MPEGGEDSKIRTMAKDGENSFAYMFHHFELIQVKRLRNVTRFSKL